MRRYINLMATMLLGGLWHGADWTFVFWGGLNGLALCVDKLAPKFSRGAIGGCLNRIFTFGFITLTWIFFRADSFGTVWEVLRGIVVFQPGINQPFSWSFIALAALIVCSMMAARRAKEVRGTRIDGYYPLVNLSTMRGQVLFFIEAGLVLGLAYTGETPFVYFQF